MSLLINAETRTVQQDGGAALHTIITGNKSIFFIRIWCRIFIDYSFLFMIPYSLVILKLKKYSMVVCNLSGIEILFILKARYEIPFAMIKNHDFFYFILNSLSLIDFC